MIQPKKFLSLALFILAIIHSDMSANDYASCCEGDCPSFCEGFWVEAQFLWWKPCLSDNDVATVSDALIPFQGNNSIVFMPYDWEPGVRVYAGKDNLWCGWDLWGVYTYLQTTGTVDLTAPADGLLFSDYLLANLGSGVVGFFYSTSDSIHQKQKLNYQTYEILFSRTAFNVNCLSLTPYFGVEGLLLDQTLNFSTSTDGNSLSIDASLDYHGVGLKTGIDLLFPLNNCFGFFANTSIAMVYGTKHWKITGNGVTNQDTPLNVNTTIKANECLFVPGYDIQIGLDFATCWCGTQVGAKVGWEFLQWCNISQINRFSTNHDKLTLGFQGLIVGGFVKF